MRSLSNTAWSALAALCSGLLVPFASLAQDTSPPVQVGVRARSADAAELAVMGDRHGGRALQRMPALSVTTGRYAYVRGLGLGDTGTSLGGLRLASPETGTSAVPLDLLPISTAGTPGPMLGGANLWTAYRPDLPGHGGGSYLDLSPAAYPEEWTLTLAALGAYRTRTTWQEGLSYDGGRWDWLTYDDGTRALPAEIADTMLLRRGDQTVSELAALGLEFDNVWAADSFKPPPDAGLSLSTGGRVPLGKAELSLQGGLYYLNAYRTSRRRETEYLPTTGMGDDALAVWEQADTLSTTHASRLAATLAARADYAPGHATETRLWWTRGADDTAAMAEGFRANEDADVRATTLRFDERQVLAWQLLGEHRLGGGTAPRLEYRYGFSSGKGARPDERSHEYLRSMSSDSMPFRLSSSPGPRRSFTKVDDTLHDVGLDLTVPFGKGSWGGAFKVGALGLFRETQLHRRTFQFDAPSTTSTDDLSLPIEEILGPEMYSANGWRLEEISTVPLRRQASQRVLGVYATLELVLPVGFDVLTGARIENARLQEHGMNLPGEPRSFEATSPLPVVQLGYAPTDTVSLRAAYSMTVDRPDLWVFTDRSSFDLKASTLHNLDVGPAWEANGDRAFTTFFFKRIRDPIVAQFVPTSSMPARRYDNDRDARVFGVDFGGAKRFGFLTEALDDLELAANAMVLRDERPLADGTLAVDTNYRPYHSPRFTLNARLNYQHAHGRTRPGTYAAVAYHVTGERAQAPVPELPQPILQPIHLLDVILQQPLGAGFSLAFVARNLLDKAIRTTVADRVTRREYLGRTFELGLSWRPL